MPLFSLEILFKNGKLVNMLLEDNKVSDKVYNIYKSLVENKAGVFFIKDKGGSIYIFSLVDVCCFSLVPVSEKNLKSNFKKRGRKRKMNNSSYVPETKENDVTDSNESVMVVSDSGTLSFDEKSLILSNKSTDDVLSNSVSETVVETDTLNKSFVNETGNEEQVIVMKDINNNDLGSSKEWMAL